MNLEMLEIVLTELLEEQKKETIMNVEMVSIVRRVLERLEVMEQLIQPKDDTAILEQLRDIKIACQDRPVKQTYPSAPTRPVQAIIKHHFFFKTTTVTAISFFVVIVILSGLYIREKSELDNHRANDIKYRYLKLNSSPNLEKILSHTDSLYRFAPDSMKRKVERLEMQQQKQLERSEKTSRPEQQSSKRVAKNKFQNRF